MERSENTDAVAKENAAAARLAGHLHCSPQEALEVLREAVSPLDIEEGRCAGVIFRLTECHS